MTTQELEPPTVSTLAARRGEGMLLLIQDNERKSVIIGRMNEVLASMLGYTPEEMENQPLTQILGAAEATLVTDDLEYDDHAADFGDLFSRLREVRLRRRTGDEIRVNCTLSRLMAQGKNACFQLLIPNEYERLTTNKLQEFIRLNLDGRSHLDAATGLPDHHTAQEFLPLLKTYFAEGEANIVYAQLQLDRFDKSVARYGAAACSQLLMHAYQCCRSTFRSEDLIFALSDRALGVVLFNISRESARVVFNRLRWKIRSQRFAFGGKADFSISTCIAFDVLDLEQALKAFEQCAREIEKIDANERNMLVELGD